MTGLADYVFAWNDWMVMPALLVIAFVSFIKLRKASLALLVAGLFLYSAATVFLFLYPSPLTLGHGASVIVQSAGLLLSVGVFAWFWLKHRVPASMQPNSTLHADAKLPPK